jgi:biopolymer transport protein TolQ
MFLGAGPMALFVLLVLVVLSVVSWAIMISKWARLRRAERHSERFLDLFRKSKRFSEVNAAAGRLYASPLVGLFQTGYVEIDAQVKAAGEAGAAAGGGASRYRIKSLEAVERSLRRAAGVEVLSLTRGTGILATTAAASPFIGLFGTVWGIMIAFRDIGLTGSTSLVAVAPGISEALVNTAAGLGAAIPALMGYNYFSNRIRHFRIEMEDFMLEFLNLTERNFT